MFYCNICGLKKKIDDKTWHFARKIYEQYVWLENSLSNYILTILSAKSTYIVKHIQRKFWISLIILFCKHSHLFFRSFAHSLHSFIIFCAEFLSNCGGTKNAYAFETCLNYQCYILFNIQLNVYCTYFYAKQKQIEKSSLNALFQNHSRFLAQ